MDCDFLAEICENSFNWCLENARRSLERRNPNHALGWCSTAAWLASRRSSFGLLASPDIEHIIARAASVLPRPFFQRKEGCQGKRWLHVFTEAYEVYGHTKLCRIWIENDAAKNCHSVLLTSQDYPIPENLRVLVESKGGSLVKLDPSLPLLDRAAALREYAYEHADAVVLHIHMDDLIPMAAFSVPGGPPVVYMNHADHAFWIGRSVADVVFDIRDSGRKWTLNHRCVPRSQIVPIPLDRTTNGDEAFQKQAKAEARRKLSLPQSAVILLTIGGAKKYLPMKDLDFTLVAERILQRNPQALLIAVGPKCTGNWKRLSLLTQGRLQPVGVQADLTNYHLAADIYLEGFPAGSLTAMLEAGLAKLPCVSAPKQVAPPCSSDGIALGEVRRPVDLDDYVAQVEALIADPETRRQQGIALSHRIFEHHCGDGWLQYLEHACAKIPQVHEVYADRQPKPLPIETRDFLLRFYNRFENDEPYVPLLIDLLSMVKQKVVLNQELDQPLEKILEKCWAHTSVPSAGAKDVKRFQRHIAHRAVSNALTALAVQNSDHGKRTDTIRFALRAFWCDFTRLVDVEIYKAIARGVLGNSAYKRIGRLTHPS